MPRAYSRNVNNASDKAPRAADRLGELRQDAGYALRTLRRSPGFAIVSIVTLALAIGANTAIFSVAQAVLLKPLPYAAPGSLVAFYEGHPKNPNQRLGLSAPNLADYRTQQHTLTAIASYYTRIATWQAGNSDPQIATVTAVTANMFDVLGVPAWRGRTFAADEGADANSTKVVLSYQFWQTALGGDASIVGRTMTIYNSPYDVIGIMPRGFTLGADEAFWVPFDFAGDLSNAAVTRKQHIYECVARIKPGVTLRAARADVAAISGRLDAEYPDVNSDLRATVTPLREAMARNVHDPVLLLLGAAVLILLIACANLANVTLSRSMGRRTEMAVRAALGAGRGRLARQLLTESMMLSIGGGACGVAVGGHRDTHAPRDQSARAARRVRGRHRRAHSPVQCGRFRRHRHALRVRAGRFRSAFRSSRRAERSRTRGTGGRASERLRHVLVIAQVSLAVMLLVGAGLLVRSFREVSTVRLGYDPANVITAQLRVDGTRYDSSSAVNQFYDDVLGAIARTPGVVAAGASMSTPAQGKEYSTMFLEGAPPAVGAPPDIGYNMVRGDWFKALKIPLVAGRTFNATDTPDGPKVVMINEAAARTYFPGGNAVGSRVRIGPNPAAPWVTIVGVVGDMRDAANWEAPAAIDLRQRRAANVVALAVRRGADHRRSTVRRARDSRRGQIRGPDARAARRRNARRSDRRKPLRAPLRARPRRLLRGPRARARRGRDLRCAGLQRQRAHPRVRRPPRTRSDREQRHDARAASRIRVVDCRAHDRHRRSAGVRAAAREFALRRKLDGRHYIHRRRPRASRCRTRRVRRTGEPRDAGRSDQQPARRIATRREWEG